MPGQTVETFRPPAQFPIVMHGPVWLGISIWQHIHFFFFLHKVYFYHASRALPPVCKL